MLHCATQRNRKNIVLWELLAADIRCIAYHAYRVSCVTLGKMKGHEKKCNSKFILYIY